MGRASPHLGTGPCRAVTPPFLLVVLKRPSPTPSTLLLTWVWFSPRAGRKQAGRWLGSGDSSAGLSSSAFHTPPQGCACGHKALAQRELQLGPLPVSRALPLATALPGRTHCQCWAEQAGGRQSGHRDSRTDQGSQSVAWWLSRSPRLDLSPIQPPREPEASMDAVDTTMEKLRAQCLSRGASGIQGVAR